MVNYRLEWILLVGENSKFVLQAGKNNGTITIPADYLKALGWELSQEVQISNAWWDSSEDSKCHRIQIELAIKPKTKGRWAK